MLAALRDDALATTTTGWELRLGLPWIRSLPLSSLIGLTVTLDGVLVGRPELPEAEHRWWFVQDRVVISVDGPIALGEHLVAISFRLMIPYLQAGPDGPLELPFAFERTLETDIPNPPGDVALDVA